MCKYHLGTEEFLLQENTSNRVVVSLADFNKRFNAPMVFFIRNFFVSHTVKFKASPIWCVVIRPGDSQFPCSSRSNHSGLLCHLTIFPLKKQEIFGDNDKLLSVVGRAVPAHRHTVWALLRHSTESALVIPLQSRDLVLNSPRTHLPGKFKLGKSLFPTLGFLHLPFPSALNSTFYLFIPVQGRFDKFNESNSSGMNLHPFPQDLQ